MRAKTAVQSRGQNRELARYLNAPYVRMIIPNAEEGRYLAEVLELPGCITEGRTLEEAYGNLEEAMAGWIAASLDTNRPIPDPVGDKEYSGHFPLRISSELHRAAALRALHEGVSLNQWIAKAMAAHVAKEDVLQNLADEIASKVAQRLSVKVSAGLRFDVTGVEPSLSMPIPYEVPPLKLEAWTEQLTTLRALFSGRPTEDAVGAQREKEVTPSA